MLRLDEPPKLQGQTDKFLNREAFLRFRHSRQGGTARGCWKSWASGSSARQAVAQAERSNAEPIAWNITISSFLACASFSGTPRRKSSRPSSSPSASSTPAYCS